MKTIKAVIERHPVLSYFVLTFAISWGGVLIVVGGPGGLSATNKEQIDALFPIALLAMVAGPSVAGILLTGLVYGRAGLREFGSRLLRWRVGARWYAVALLIAPLVFTVVLLTLSLTSSEYLPGILTSDDKASVLLMGIFAGLIAGIFEELGWTGFAVPRMRLRYGVLATDLVVGLDGRIQYLARRRYPNVGHHTWVVGYVVEHRDGLLGHGLQGVGGVGYGGGPKLLVSLFQLGLGEMPVEGSATDMECLGGCGFGGVGHESG